MKRKHLKVVTVAATLLAAALAAPSTAQAVEVSFERDTSLPLVYVNVAVRGGAVTDPGQLLGLTNFMGEMLRRGTKSKTKEQIDLALDQMGARLEFETRSEALIVRGAVLNSQLGPFLGLVTEILTEPSFPETEIRKLKGEITSGILEELGNDASLASRAFNEFLFQGHPYGKPVLGKIKDVQRITRNDVIQHYERYLRGANLVVVGTGDADKGRIDSFADSIAKLRERSGVPAVAVEKVAPPKPGVGRRLLIVDKPERTQTQINFGQLGVRMTDPSYFPLYLGNYAFGGGSFSARLMVEVRVKRGWSYGATSHFRQGLQPRSWQVHLFPAEKDTASALNLTLGMTDGLREKGITREEFDFAQRSLVNSSGFMYDTPKKRVENTLLERTLDLPEGFMKSYGPELQKVKYEQVNEALRGFVKPDQLAITVVGTAQNLREPLAKAAGIPASQVQVVPYNQE